MNGQQLEGGNVRTKGSWPGKRVRDARQDRGILRHGLMWNPEVRATREHMEGTLYYIWLKQQKRGIPESLDDTWTGQHKKDDRRWNMVHGMN